MEIESRTHAGTRPLDGEDAALAFAALGSAPRLAVLRALVRAGDDGLPVGRLQERLGLAASTLSHHLRALVQAGVIAQVRDGRSLQCKAQYETIRGLAEFLLSECCADRQETDCAPEELVTVTEETSG